ncbi:hypothetical protein ABZX85_38275 [Streptomyces sp. NPDC004539]|uniref:hypothetical protein n=1 Tax=Streptomyces sp. NPDC004539 TaxID=3154280 RepID=UPI0033BF1E3F
MRAEPGNHYVERGGRHQMDWQRDAACADAADPGLSFPATLTGPGAHGLPPGYGVDWPDA